MKPRLRGLLHLYAFIAALLALPVLLLVADRPRRLCRDDLRTQPGRPVRVSALFHRVTWSHRARRWMGRLDHAMIDVLIAGTFTPFGLLVLSPTLATVLLAVVWGGALAALLLHVLWIDAPKWLSALVYLVLGWSGIAALPELVAYVGWGPTALLALGGALYSAGAAVYTLRRPDPVPAVFGYHEVFHALVIAAALSHYAVVALYVLPHA